MAKKKSGPAGRYGVRYGKSIRKKVNKIEKKLKTWHKCPYCTKQRVKRVAVGIWQCRSCNSKFTGRAYEV